MAIKGRFNTDAEALKKRINAHQKFGSRDINEWIFQHLQPAEAQTILDLGCGTGKQSIPLAGIVGPSGHILAVDVSADALAALMTEAAQKGVSERITPLNCGLDDIPEHLTGKRVDRALSSYSLYYAEHPDVVMTAVRDALRDGGVFFFCGPSRDNNRELKAFHYDVKGTPMPPLTGGAAFMEETGPRLARMLFPQVDIVTFENPLRFDSPQALYAYWSSYNLYDPEIDAAFRDAVDAFFRRHNVFATYKRVLGVRARK